MRFVPVPAVKCNFDRPQEDDAMNAMLPLPENETPAFPSVEAYLVGCDVSAEVTEDWWLDLGVVNVPGVLAV